MSDDHHRSRRYEIRIAGALGEHLVQAFAGMRAARLEPGELLRIEVNRDDWDAADVAALLRERGHSIRSVRRCDASATAGPTEHPTD